MTRSSRRGDTAHWMNSRRKEYERIDEMCLAGSKEMDDYRICLIVARLLNDSDTEDGYYVAETSTDGKNKVHVEIRRPNCNGVENITLTITEG